MKDFSEKSKDNGTPSSFNPVVKNGLNTVNHEKELDPNVRKLEIVHKKRAHGRPGTYNSMKNLYE